ncbi:MAG: hypothetical protein K0R15_2450 [Clostridiales bacterium]|jgi:hypothetical protein|nr:hypothetical protein [Clostridiales bacterium]
MVILKVDLLSINIKEFCIYIIILIRDNIYNKERYTACVVL